MEDLKARILAELARQGRTIDPDVLAFHLSLGTINSDNALDWVASLDAILDLRGGL